MFKPDKIRCHDTISKVPLSCSDDEIIGTSVFFPTDIHKSVKLINNPQNEVSVFMMQSWNAIIFKLQYNDIREVITWLKGCTPFTFTKLTKAANIDDLAKYVNQRTCDEFILEGFDNPIRIVEII